MNLLVRSSKKQFIFIIIGKTRKKKHDNANSVEKYRIFYFILCYNLSRRIFQSST